MATTGLSYSDATDAAGAAAGALDLVVGLPTPGTGAGSEAAVGTVREALAVHAPSLRWLLVVAAPRTGEAEEPSRPGAADVVRVGYQPRTSDALQVPYHGLAGRARALHAIFTEAQTRQARACVVIDPRVSAPATCLDDLIRPLVDDAADFVTPVYNRHPFTGALVHGLLYPLFRAVYGARLRYPIGAHLGCSRAFIDAIVADTVWETDVAQIGIDLWLAATAVSGGFRIGQVQMGDCVEERAELDLGTILSQVIGCCFLDMERRAAGWQRARGSRPVPVFGTRLDPPPAPDVDMATLADAFRLASRDLQNVWAEVLPPLAVMQWRRVAAAPNEAFRVDDALWARTIYDFVMGHRLRVMTRDHLLRSLAPLYLAWLASFVREVRALPADEAEAAIERLCVVFEAEKPYLVSQWRWPERFKPVKRRQTASGT